MIKVRIVKDMVAMSQELRRLLEQAAYGIDDRICLHGQTWSPQMDIYETPEVFVLIAETPGMNPEEFEVIVDRRHLKISGCRRQPSPPPYLRAHQIEIGYGRFERAFRLPSPIRPEEARASLEQGLLKMVLPKEVPARTRIEIR